jgi:hypothetical protein
MPLNQPLVPRHQAHWEWGVMAKPSHWNNIEEKLLL